jgi:glyoxylase-like metal-dependent hydrolase (beta-lactamase superfamily II)
VSRIALSLKTSAVFRGRGLTANKQWQRSVTRRRRRGASASFHCAHGPRITRQRELRRSAQPENINDL